MLIHIDGFDYYETSQINEQWDASSGAAISAGTGRRSSGALLLASGASVDKTVSLQSTLVCGVSYKTAALPALGDIFKFIDTGVTQVSIKVNSAGAILAYLGDSTALLGTSASGVVVAGDHYYIEAKVFIHDSTGTVTVRVTTPGEILSTVLNLTGLDTKATALAQISTVRILGATTDVYYDDCYMVDTTGATNNDFLGDSRVDTTEPIEDGTYTDFTPSTGTDLFAMVDETPRSTDYLLGDTVMAQATFRCTPITAVSGTIAGVQVTVVAKKMDTNPASIQPMVRSGETDSYGDAHSLTTLDTPARYIEEVNPETLTTWTEAGVNGSEFGERMM